MPKGYWIVQVDVHDAAAYKAYQALTPAALARFGGRMIVRGGAQEIREGSARPRSVVVEFPSLQAAENFRVFAGILPKTLKFLSDRFSRYNAGFFSGDLSIAKP